LSAERAGGSVGDRVSANQARFRRANDQLRGRYIELLAMGAVPFICECGNERCTRVMSLTLEEYATVRAHTGRFAIVSGHELADAERVVDANDRYAVVEKQRAASSG
jgi:hypothetical protein